MNAASRTVSGELTFETVPALYRESLGWFAGSPALVIDLAPVTRADSAGLALLIEWLRGAEKAGCQLKFTNIPQQVQNLIRINGLNGALQSAST